MELTHCAKLGKSAPCLIFALLLLTSFSLVGASEQSDITGTYVSEITTNKPTVFFGRKKTRSLVLKFEQHGKNISVTNSAYNLDVRAVRDGDTITFTMWSPELNKSIEVKGVWKVNADATKLKGTWNSGGSGFVGDGRWNLTKVDGPANQQGNVTATKTTNQSEPANKETESAKDEEREKLQADIDRLAAEMNKLAEEKRKFEEEKKKQAKTQQVLVKEMVGAENGNAKTQMKLGDRYSKGDGVEQDYAEAFSWYSKAANQGIALAQLYVGNMYFKGQGVRQNNRKAVEWLDKAAKQGNEEAKDNVLEARYKLSLENRQNEKMAAKRAEEERIAAEKKRIEEKRRAEAQAKAKVQAEAHAKAVATKKAEKEAERERIAAKEKAEREKNATEQKRKDEERKVEMALEKDRKSQKALEDSMRWTAYKLDNGVYGAEIPSISQSKNADKAVIYIFCNKGFLGFGTKWTWTGAGGAGIFLQDQVNNFDFIIGDRVISAKTNNTRSTVNGYLSSELKKGSAFDLYEDVVKRIASHKTLSV